MSDVIYAADDATLRQAIDLLAPSEFIALDTEFMRESTYYPVLCLIQAATRDGCVIIDPLALQDLQPFWTFLEDRNRVKVLHAARQDLEVMSQAPRSSDQRATTSSEARRSLATIPVPMFDTQIAAALLGHSAQIGYGNLVAERLGHSLAKGHARTDWTRRPLSAEQLSYAADDVRYLFPLYLELRAALEAQGRLVWLEEEMQKLTDPAMYVTEPHDAWRRLKGLDRLKPVQRLAAKRLAAWRETKAMKHDRPRGWILPDDALREIAERLPSSPSQLAELKLVSPATVRKHAEELLQLVEAAKDAADSEPAYELPGKPDPEQVSRVSQLMNVVRSKAQEMQIAPELLATRRDIERLVFSGRSDELMTGWRFEVIGQQLRELAGR